MQPIILFLIRLFFLILRIANRKNLKVQCSGLKKHHKFSYLKKIRFTLYHKASKICTDPIIGTYELDLTAIYFSLHHEIYQSWLTLNDPTDESEEIMVIFFFKI